MKRILFIPDVHVPYHDVKMWNVMLKTAKNFRPEIVVILGDFADFYAVSSHSKDPRRKALILEESAVAKALLVKLRDSLPGVKQWHFTEGNHEHRLQRYIADKAPALHGITNTRQLLGLDKTWRFTPYREATRIGKLWVTHDMGHAGKTALRASQAAAEGNIVIGHTHRMEMMVCGSAMGDRHVAASFGWLGDVSEVDYMHRIKANREWSHGFGLGYMLGNGNVHLIPVPIVSGKAIIHE